jgi:hypothetical protein
MLCKSGQFYTFGVVGIAVDGRVAESSLIWKAPDALVDSEVSINVSLEMGSDSEDDIVLKAEAENIDTWRWIATSELNLSNRSFLSAFHINFFSSRIVLAHTKKTSLFVDQVCCSSWLYISEASSEQTCSSR